MNFNKRPACTTSCDLQWLTTNKSSLLPAPPPQLGLLQEAGNSLLEPSSTYLMTTSPVTLSTPQCESQYVMTKSLVTLSAPQCDMLPVMSPAYVSLTNRDMWLKFDRHVTEMIITKTGRWSNDCIIANTSWLAYSILSIDSASISTGIKEIHRSGRLTDQWLIPDKEPVQYESLICQCS